MSPPMATYWSTDPWVHQQDLRIVGWDLRIIGYVRHGVWHQTKVLSKQRVLGHDAQLSAITYNHFGTYIHMYHGSGNDFTDLRIPPPPSPSLRPALSRASANQVTAGWLVGWLAGWLAASQPTPSDCHCAARVPGHIPPSARATQPRAPALASILLADWLSGWLGWLAGWLAGWPLTE